MTRVWLNIALLSGLIASYSVFLWYVPPATILVSLSAKTEYVAYSVIDPDHSAFRVTGMDLDGPGSVETCVDRIVTPGVGATVAYRRGKLDEFQIMVTTNGDAPTTLQAPGGQPIQMQGHIAFRSARCGAPPPWSLPVWGPAQIGDVLRPAGEQVGVPGALLDATVSVFAIAHDHIFLLHFPSLIYKVNTFQVPPGSVLSKPEGADSCGRDAKLCGGGAWLGQAQVDGTSPGFLVLASSTVRRLSIRPPGLPHLGTAGDYDVDLGSYAQFLTDPNLVEVQFLFGIVLLMINAVRSANTIYDSARESFTSSSRESGRES